jgi:hypothetical protein
MKTWQEWGRLALLTTLVVLSLYEPAWAATGARTAIGRFMGELYQEGVGTWIPFIALLVLIGGVINWHQGYVDIGPGLGKTIVCIWILAIGVSGIISYVGGNIAEGAVRVAPIADESPLP